MSGRSTTNSRVLERAWDVEEGALDVEAVFAALFADAPVAFWLDGEVASPEGRRRSHLGDGSGPLAHVLRHRAGETEVERLDAAGTRREPGGVLDVLARCLALGTESGTGPDSAAGGGCAGTGGGIGVEGRDAGPLGGYVGYLGYEIGVECGAAASGRSAYPDAQWLFVDRVVTVDHDHHHGRSRVRLAALTDGTPEVDAAQEEWLAATATRLASWGAPGSARRHVRTRDLGPPRDPDVVRPRESDRGRPGEVYPRGTATRPAVTVEPLALERHLVRGRATYLADVRHCLEALRAGESYEVCLTNAVDLPAPDDPLEFYRRLRRANPAPYAAYLRFDDLAIASSSPERFLRVVGGTAESRPIKGTAPRGASPEEDRAIRDMLAADPKARAENLMIVDLLRNDLTRVCEVGTVETHGLMAVERYATVHQMVTTVRGRLRAGLTAVDAVRACFPPGSMTGAPKRRTTEICAELEGGPRGVYSGALGWLGADGSADLAVVIRTAVIHDCRCRIGAGGAIVLDSHPEAEYDEMLLKAASTLRAHPEVAEDR